VTITSDGLAARDEHLDDHANDASYGQLGIVEHLGLQVDLLLRISRIQSQRVPLEVARDTIRFESPICAAAEWLLGCGCGEDFDGADCRDNKGAECLEWCLLECEMNAATEEVNGISPREYPKLRAWRCGHA